MNGLEFAILAIYFLPALIAVGKRNWLGIAFLNVLIGWTVIGWVACFIWACASADAKPLFDPGRLFAPQRPAANESWPPGRNEITVHGEAQHNADGTSRQRIIAGLCEDDAVTLVREPDNPHDANAIRVDSANGTIGYVARDEALTLAPVMDAGRVSNARILDIAGGSAEKPSRGVWLTADIDAASGAEPQFADRVPAAGYIGAAVFIAFVAWAIFHSGAQTPAPIADAAPAAPAANASLDAAGARDEAGDERCAAAFARAESKHLLPPGIAADNMGGHYCTGGALAYRVTYRTVCDKASAECVRVKSILRVADGKYLFAARN